MPAATTTRRIERAITRPRLVVPWDRSADGDLGRLRHREAVVARPLEREGAALGGDRREGDERVRGDRRMELGAEDLGTVVGADEGPDDVARNRDAELRPAIARLHRVRDERLDLDDLAAAR